MSERRGRIHEKHELSKTRRCELLDVPRSSAYYRGESVSEADLAVMRLIDEIHLQLPFYGSRRMRDELEERGHTVNRKRVQRLMRQMDLRALYPRRRTSQPGKGHKIYPYLLRDLSIERANQAWASDISYIPMAKGFMYLVAIMDWYSRRVLSWRVSNTLDADFCIEALEEALQRFEAPEIFNTDQGSQFTCEAFTDVLKGHAIAISMDGKGRWVDNVFVERLWRSVKYEDVYLRAYETPTELRAGLARYFGFLQHQAPSQRTGPTHPRCGVLRPGSPRFGSLKPEEDFTYHTVQFSGSISRESGRRRRRKIRESTFLQASAQVRAPARRWVMSVCTPRIAGTVLVRSRAGGSHPRWPGRTRVQTDRPGRAFARSRR